MSMSDSYQFSTLNPATGKILDNYYYDSNQVIESSLQLSFESYKMYSSSVPMAERIEILYKVAESLKNNVLELSQAITQEVGKPIADSKAEVLKSATAYEYYAKNAIEMLKQDQISDGPPSLQVEVLKKPLGPILAIMPWNFPIWQLSRVLAPSILLGNPVLCKPSDLNPETAKLFEKIVSQSSSFFESNKMLHNLFVSHAQTEAIIQDSRIRGVTFTGSTRGGKSVAALAGGALKKSVLELGGSDPYLVFADADLEYAADQLVRARLVNNGQSCVAAKRFIIHRSVARKMKKLIYEKVAEFKIGSPFDEATNLGTLARLSFKKNTISQLDHLYQLGVGVAEVIPTKNPEEARSFEDLADAAYFQPRWVELKTPSIEARRYLRQQEFFAPVFLVSTFETTQEAIELANDSDYALGAAVFSKDRITIEKCLEEIEAGMIFVNERLQSDARLPFGGVKDSGFGRELSRYGFLEFANLQTFAVRL